MSNPADIRQWARDQGLEVGKGGAIPARIMDAWRDAHPDADLDGGMGGPQPAERSDQDAPVPPQVAASPVSRVRSWWRSRGSAPAPKTRRARSSLEDVGAFLWGGLATAAERLGGTQYLPVARVLAMQAPIAGAVADDVLKGTVIDRMLQPFARAGKRAGAVGALLGPPVIVGVITGRPELYPVLQPVLKGLLKQWLAVAGPKIRKAREREAELVAEFGQDYDQDLDAMIAAFFAPPPGAPEQAYEPSPAADDVLGTAVGV